MRIELPSASWAETLQRAEDDAHTLTIEGVLAAGPFAAMRLGEAAATLRIEVPEGDAAPMTITF